MADQPGRSLLFDGCHVAAMAFVGAVLGFILGLAVPSFAPQSPPPTLVLPLPHHIPKTPGGVSLRCAMVQDMIHERFARHGRAYYEERNRRCREALAGSLPDDRRDALTDDFGAGLDHLGNDDEAVRLLRDKLKSQQAHGLSGKSLYTTYANLGTFLIHGSARAAMAGDSAAKERLREGKEFIYQAIAANPDAHFGREIWQEEAVEFLLAAMDQPALLREFDLIGNRLDATVEQKNARAMDNQSRVIRGLFWEDDGPRWQRDPSYYDQAFLYRPAITRVGAEDGWPTDEIPSHGEPIGFDEPVLGIIGMWRQGGGANPHFALCLGEIMLRVGQRYLAWTAFERAFRMADRFWPDPDLQQFLRDHCRKRQAMLEAQLPAADVAALRPRFEAELTFGQGYQEAYQRYEADQIARGASIEDEHFYDRFHREHGTIASPVGPEDEMVVYDGMAEAKRGINVFLWSVAGSLLGAGIAAFGTAWTLRHRPRGEPAA